MHGHADLQLTQQRSGLGTTTHCSRLVISPPAPLSPPCSRRDRAPPPTFYACYAAGVQHEREQRCPPRHPFHCRPSGLAHLICPDLVTFERHGSNAASDLQSRSSLLQPTSAQRRSSSPCIEQALDGELFGLVDNRDKEWKTNHCRELKVGDPASPCPRFVLKKFAFSTLRYNSRIHDLSMSDPFDAYFFAGYVTL